MASKDYLAARHYAAEDVAVRTVADAPVVYRIRHLGDGTSTPTVVMSSSSSILTLTAYVLVAGVDTADAQTVNFGVTYTTVGAVADRINGLKNTATGQLLWECKVLDALRADASDNVVIDGSATTTTDEYGNTVFDILQDTSSSFNLTYRCTYNRTFVDGIPNQPSKNNSQAQQPKGSHRVNLSKFVYFATVGSDASANAVRIYSYVPRSQTETQIWGNKSVSGVATTHTFTDPLTAGDGNDLIVRVLDAASLADSGAYLDVEYSRE